MATLPIHSVSGTQAGEMELPASIFGEGANAAVLHQVVTAELAAKRQGTASTKTRSEVAGSTRKLWRQKGTGRSRVGDRTPPGRVGGGLVTGPRPRDYRQRMGKSLKGAGLRAALEAQAAAGSVMLVEPFELTEAKTRALVTVMTALGGARGALLVLGQPSEIIVRCGRNLPDFRVVDAARVNAYDVISARKVVIVTDALPQLEARVS
jgi:large subunit ribosomal protein L4